MAGSTLMLDEHFDAGDDRFLAELFACESDKKLKALATRWYTDRRPWARKALLAYVDDGCERRNHRPLVKTLFKLAEAAGDDEAMGHFLVAFDRLVRHSLVKEQRYDWNTRTTIGTWKLVRDASVQNRSQDHDKKGKAPTHFKDRAFSLRTRLYLQRRAWRYFRNLGHKEPGRYFAAITAALALYDDANLQRPEQVLDAWGLMHALYYGSPVVVRDPMGVKLAPDKTLAELAPAPHLPELFAGEADALLTLLARARSRTVRSFVIALLERDQQDALKGLPLTRLKALLKSPHEEVQTFAARLLSTASGLETLPLAEWLSLLEIDNPLALPMLCDLVKKNVSPERLSLAQCVTLACLRPAPVAELGLAWTRQKNPKAADLDALVKIGMALSPRVRTEAAEWVVGLIGATAESTPKQLRELVDSRYDDVRRPALALMAKEQRFGDDPLLWTALCESPYDDVRAFLVRHLAAREKALATSTVHHVWASTLLAVHRGGRAKREVPAQVANRILRCPDETEALLPLLSVALRSVRVTERRTALAALTTAALDKPALREAMAKHLPELKLLAEEAA